MSWTESDIGQFLYGLGIALSIALIVFGLIKTWQRHKQEQEVTRQARLHAIRLWHPPFNEEYRALHASLLSHIDEIKRKL